MGLLDSLFDQSNYGGDQGLLARLAQMTAAVPPSGGFSAQNNQPSPLDGVQWPAGPNGAPQPVMPPGRQFDPATFDPQTYAPNQAQPIGVGGYQMPRMGSADLYNPQQANTPPNAQPTQGQLPPGAPAPQQAPPQAQPGLPPALGGGSYIDNLRGGAGLIGAAFGGSSQQKNLKAQYDSLVPILGSQKAMLAVMNPEAGKTLLSEALTNKADWGVVGEDALGNKQYGWINKIDQTINGKSAEDVGGSGGNPNGVPSTGNFSFLAPGVKQVDSALKGDDYLKQYSPEVQAAVKDYVEGRAMPTGNPRKGFTQTVKMIAQKYGSDIGTPADDAAFAERRKMRTDIGASSNSSMGGILSNGKSAFEHLKTYSDKLVDVGNVNHDYPGGGVAANVQNSVGNYLGSSTQRGKVSAATEAGLKYGQESTKFYSGSGGGAEERMAALRANDANSKSGAEQAGFLQAERDLMLGRLQEKEKQIRDVLGQDYLDKHPVMTPDLQKTVATIDANIARLRGDQATAPSGPDRSAIEAEMRRRGLLK